MPTYQFLHIQERHPSPLCPYLNAFPEDYSRLIQCTDNQVIAQWYQNLYQFVQYPIILYTLTLTIATLEYKLSELFSI